MSQALWHAISDWIEQAQKCGVDLDIGPPGVAAVGCDKGHHSGTSSIWTPPVASTFPQTSADFGSPPGVTLSSTARSSAQAWLEAPLALPAADVLPSSGTGLAAPCSIPVHRRIFEVWAGKKQRWAQYSESAQKDLRAASEAGSTETIVRYGWEYNVNTDGAHMTDVPTFSVEAGACKKRYVRIRDSDGLLPEDYGVEDWQKAVWGVLGACV